MFIVASETAFSIIEIIYIYMIEGYLVTWEKTSKLLFGARHLQRVKINLSLSSKT